MKSKILKIFSTEDKRSNKININISASLVVKSYALVLSFVRIPLLLSYLNPEKFGIWLTIVSIIEWIRYFDFGLGNGLRNKLAENFANNNSLNSKSLISTAYVSLSSIMFLLFLFIFPFIFILDWNSILNISSISSYELKYSILILIFTFIIQFILQLISYILRADQRPALADIFLPISSTISIILILFLPIIITDSFIMACIVIAIPQLIVLLFANFYFFKMDYFQFRPQLILFDKNKLNDIYSLGIKFFLGQLGSLIMFSSTNFIIIYNINPNQVTIYNIAYKYFSIPLMFFMIIVSPYWSAVTDAYTKGDYIWIKMSMKRLNKLSFIFSFLILFMLLVSDKIYYYWIGEIINVPYNLSIALAFYNISIIFLSPYTHFINGFGTLNLGIRIILIKMIFFLPVAIHMTKTFGSVGLVYSLLIVNSAPNMIFSTIQYYKLSNKTAYGIWGK